MPGGLWRDQVSKLTAYERLYALYFLARCGPDHENGQALQRALAAVERHQDGSK
jgi:hypothetical protein